jgi:hypothetical protein
VIRNEAFRQLQVPFLGGFHPPIEPLADGLFIFSLRVSPFLVCGAQPMRTRAQRPNRNRRFIIE